MAAASGSEKEVWISPWNFKNRLITEKELQSIFDTIGIASKIRINDLNLYQRAFVHSSYVKETADQALSNHKVVKIQECPSGCLGFQKESYENLEFLGDRVIELSVVWYLYERFPMQDEGFKTKIKTKLVNTDSLAKIALYLGFDKHLILAKHVDESCSGRFNQHILEDSFEAFIGALFQDQQNQHRELKPPYTVEWKDGHTIPYPCPAWGVCHAIITHLIENCMDLDSLIETDTNYKDQLLQLFQQHYSITPSYKELGIDGPPHSRTFIMGVCAPGGGIMARGKGNSKKKAEQMASKKAIELIQEKIET